jgi:hypothetical protein
LLVLKANANGSPECRGSQPPHCERLMANQIFAVAMTYSLMVWRAVQKWPPTLLINRLAIGFNPLPLPPIAYFAVHISNSTPISIDGARHRNRRSDAAITVKQVAPMRPMMIIAARRRF